MGKMRRRVFSFVRFPPSEKIDGFDDRYLSVKTGLSVKYIIY